MRLFFRARRDAGFFHRRYNGQFGEPTRSKEAMDLWRGAGRFQPPSWQGRSGLCGSRPNWRHRKRRSHLTRWGIAYRRRELPRLTFLSLKEHYETALERGH